MNPLSAKQQFLEHGLLLKLDKEKLADLLFMVSCQTETQCSEEPQYIDGVGYAVKEHRVEVPTKLAIMAYELLTSWEK